MIRPSGTTTGAGARAGMGFRAPGPRYNESVVLSAVRYGIPATFIVAGFVVLALDNEAWVSWAGFVGAGIAILLLNVLFRLSFHGERDRDREEYAREFFDRHGRWPDQQEARAREWRLPEGIATPESEAKERKR